MSYDAWKTNAPDPGTVPDRCQECGCELFPDERDVCVTCLHEALAVAGEDDDREPGDPDGEEYGRDRDAEYRDSQIAAQRLK